MVHSISSLSDDVRGIYSPTHTITKCTQEFKVLKTRKIGFSISISTVVLRILKEIVCLFVCLCDMSGARRRGWAKTNNSQKLTNKNNEQN